MNIKHLKLLQLLFIGCFLTLLIPSASRAAILDKNSVWQGEVRLSEDILVPKGITLTIKPGTTVRVAVAEGTKTDPEYTSPMTEITVRGTLMIEGTRKEPVVLLGEEGKTGNWAGIIIDNGTALISHCRINNAETGIHSFDGQLQINDSTLQGNRYGLVLQGNKSDSTLDNSLITGNDYGVFLLLGANLKSNTSRVEGNRKKDRFIASPKPFQSAAVSTSPETRPVSRRYRDEAFRGDTIWQGRIEVAGTVRVPQGSRLIIMPGTIVEFLKKDSNGDRIGENGIMIQGRIVAKGTKDEPIIFRSAEKEKKMGDWDSINIMDSSTGQNLIEYCRIENAYRGLHFHFSNVAVYNSVIRDNYRGIQFQESQVDLKNNLLSDNRSGIQGRDSDLVFSDNTVHGNHVGANFFRSTLTAKGNRFVGNWKEGLRIREGVSTLQENLFDGNRHGLLLADMFYGSYNRNSFTNNQETGLAVRNADNIEINGNIISLNGISGMNVQDSRFVIRNNQVTDNGERGIGIQSFDGLITANNFAANGLYAIDLDGADDVAAPANWWGDDNPEKVILDKRKDPARGKVVLDITKDAAVPFSWPLLKISTDTIWRGNIIINESSVVENTATLNVAPSTKIQFAPKTGLLVKGKIIAVGKPAYKIFFTSLDKNETSRWDEIQLEYATGSIISNCVFEYANWGLHSHFTNLSVSESVFSENFGGMRFRSGPVEIKRSVFERNTIGIRSYIGNAVISDNHISNNETGIFVREKGGGLHITRNDIFNNTNYNIRVGDFNNEDVPAQYNWWGSSDPLPTIFDGRSEPGIGNVIFEPVSTGPYRYKTGVMP